MVDSKLLRVLFVDDDPGSLKAAVTHSALRPEQIVALLANRDGDKTLGEPPLGFERSAWHRITGCENVVQLSAQVGQYYQAYRCHVAAVDLHLVPYDGDVTRASSQFSGVRLAKALFRDYGARYLIWQSRAAGDILENVNPQVIEDLQVGDPTVDVSVIECPRAYIVNRNDPTEFRAAIGAIDIDIHGRLAESELEWKVPAFRLFELRQKLLVGGSVHHALKGATSADFWDVASFELIPYFDPPTPFGLWLETCGPTGISLRDVEAEAVQSPEREAVCETLEAWLDEHLWGVAGEQASSFTIDGLLGRAARGVHMCEYDCTADLEPGYVSPCSREALVRAVHNMLLNASEHRSAGRLRINATCLEHIFLLLIANPVGDAYATMQHIIDTHEEPRGLRYIEQDLRRLTLLAGEQKWGFQFGLWDDRVRLCPFGKLLQSPWLVGSIPQAAEDWIRQTIGAGSWATALIVGPYRPR